MKFKKILGRYIIRYFIAFLIIYISNILITNVAQNNIRNYILEKIRAENQEGLGAIENMVSKMELIDSMLLLDPEFSSLIFKKQLERSDVLNLAALNQKDKDIKNLVDFIPFFFSISKNNEMFVSTDQCSMNFDWYYPRMLYAEKSGTDLSNSVLFKEYLFKQYTNGNFYIELDKISFVINNKNKVIEHPVLYLENSNLMRGLHIYLTCFVIDPNDIVESIISKDLNATEFLTLINKNSNEPLLSYGNTPENILSDTTPTPWNQSYNGTYIVRNESNEYILISGLSASYVEKQMQQVHFILNIYLIGGILLVLFLSFILGFKNYKNIENVMMVLPSADLFKLKKERNEFQYVRQNIEYLKQKDCDNLIKINELITRNKGILLEHFLLNGVSSPTELQRFAHNFGREPEFFCVAIVRIEEIGEQISDLAILSLLEMFENEYNNTYFHTHSGISDELFLIELAANDVPNVESVKKFFQDAIDELIDQYDLVLHVAISSIGTNLKNINQCYEQARQIVELQNLDENVSRVVSYSIESNASYQNPVNIEFINRFYNLLKTGQLQELYVMLSKIANFYHRWPYQYELQKEQVYFSLKNIFYSTWLQIDEQHIESPFFKQIFYKDISCDDLIEQFKKECKELTEFLNKKRKSKNIELKEKIIEYINCNYNDYNLSAYSASKDMGITEKYLYTFLKEQTGITFAAYLMDVRLEHAKYLLRTTNYNNAQIAELTGFGSENTMYRNFKRYIGMTPKKYKETFE
ncbi:hypothetical protein BLA28_10795 [Eisenbergiella tayi]|uniref:helix-turn-helix domain-containing protein n=1 Tax=Eisenbergiella tayi TaxID=1432052 RepID=UPI0008FD2261|nr:helix-turn-helix domain-containing protein [Eisenbergiella tayi]OIZ65065.1 hypothetical protein BLA28_10795 [Eisenbergiella tayi]